MKILRSTIVVIVLFFWIACPVVSFASADPYAITSAELREALVQNMNLVPEFVALKQLSEKHDVQFYLFGGSASSWAHYEYWYLRHKKGDPEIYPNRLDHAYDSIYSPLEDADLVITAKDGGKVGADRLAAVQRDLESIFAGRKVDLSALHEDWIDIHGHPRMGLSNSKDFLDQNLDSQSVVLLGLFPGEKTPAIIDLKEPGLQPKGFIEDILKRRIRFFRNQKHFSTERAARGDNPEILSVIRLLSKAFRYDLSIKPSEMRSARQIISAFDPDQSFPDYIHRWLRSNSPKLLSFVVDLQKAKTTLMDLGLNEKILQLPGTERKIDGVNSLFHRLLLPSNPLGNFKPDELVQVVAHETGDLAGKSISWSIMGKPAIFISSGLDAPAAPDVAGFTLGMPRGPHGTAMNGPGFYVSLGTEGKGNNNDTRGTHIIFDLHPRAQPERDYESIHGGLRILNQDAVILRRAPPRRTALVFLEFFAHPKRGPTFDLDRYIRETLRDPQLAGLFVDEIKRSPLEFLKYPLVNLVSAELHRLLKETLLSTNPTHTNWIRMALMNDSDVETLPYLLSYLDPETRRTYASEIEKALPRWKELYIEQAHLLHDESVCAALKLLLEFPAAIRDSEIATWAAEEFRQHRLESIDLILESVQSPDHLKALERLFASSSETIADRLDQSDVRPEIMADFFNRIPALQDSHEFQKALLKWALSETHRHILFQKQPPESPLFSLHRMLQNQLSKSPGGVAEQINHEFSLSRVNSDYLASVRSLLQLGVFSRTLISEGAAETIGPELASSELPFLDEAFLIFPEWSQSKKLKEIILHKYLKAEAQYSKWIENQEFANYFYKQEPSPLRILLKSALEGLLNQKSSRFKLTDSELAPSAEATLVSANRIKASFGEKAAAGFLSLFINPILGSGSQYARQMIEIAPSLAKQSLVQKALRKFGDPKLLDRGSCRRSLSRISSRSEKTPRQGAKS